MPSPLTLSLLLTAESDLVFSSRPGSEGTHSCLDFIPGSALWGAVAARFYGSWAKTGDWEKIRSTFHSRSFRFGCGRPSDSSASPLLPTPPSWHEPKESPTPIFDLSSSDWPADHGQPKQIRSGWICTKNSPFSLKKIHHRHRLKTAIDPASFATANPGSLFGYSSIPAGNQFLATIETDSDSEAWQEISAFLSSTHSLYLGRSRSAEFGKTTIQIVPTPTPLPPASHDSFTRLHLLSDLALLSPDGSPILCPSANLFGLPSSAPLDPKRSHLRFRSYSPWNRFRACFDSERQVIAAGSVLTFASPTPPDSPSRLWIGDFCSEGLGEIAVNPPYLLSPSLHTSPSHTTTDSDQKNPDFPNPPPIFATMAHRYEDACLETLSSSIGKKWAEEWAAPCSKISKSQWARIREAATSSTSRSDLTTKLSTIGSTGLSAERQWQKPARFGGNTPIESILETINHTEFLKEELKSEHLPCPGKSEHLPCPGGRPIENLRDLLACYATREAAILSSRHKSNKKID